jgi:hypothetical protein
MGLRGWGYLPVRVRTSFRRSTVNAMLAAMTMRPSVAARLPGATQLMQLPIIAGASYIERPLSCKTSLPRWPAISGIQSFTFGTVVLDTVEPRPRTVAPHPLCRQEERLRRTGRQRTLRQRTALAREFTAADVDAALLIAPSSRWWRQAKWRARRHEGCTASRLGANDRRQDPGQRGGYAQYASHA